MIFIDPNGSAGSTPGPGVTSGNWYEEIASDDECEKLVAQVSCFYCAAPDFKRAVFGSKSIPFECPFLVAWGYAGVKERV